MFRAIMFAAAMLLGVPAMAGEAVTYKDGDLTLEGYVAKASDPDAPLVMIVHQWKGLGEYEKSRADMLAAAGFNAFAIDMYGQGIRPADTKAAGEEAGKYKNNSTLARQRLNAALEYAKTIEGADTSRIAIMGYCFGGTMALELARTGADIRSATSFHGGLATNAPVTQPGVLKASIQIHHGADDPLVKPGEVKSFMDEMKMAEADLVFTSYANAVHRFTEKQAGNDNSKGAAYNEKADHRSWSATLDFLKETLSVN